MKILKNQPAILILIIFFSSCEEKVSFQDERLVPYAENVQNQLAKRGVYINLNCNMIIKPNLKNGTVAGTSRRNSIYINEEVFNETTPLKMEALMTHELGHNRLNLSHSREPHWRDSLGRPIIMKTGTWANVNKDNISLMYDAFAETILE